MPKKTRREKIIADSRSKLQISQANPYQFNTSSFTLTQIAEKQEQSGELTQIKRDLAKTILLSIIAFGVEFSLWWYWKS